MRFVINPFEYFGEDGWVKEVTGLNRTVTNGYSIIGNFHPKNKKDWYDTEKLYLIFSSEGKGKRKIEKHSLFQIGDEGEIKVLHEVVDTRDWAVELWPTIESFLITIGPIEENLLEGISNADLLNEARRRELIPGAGEEDIKQYSDKYIIRELERRGYKIEKIETQ